MPRRPKTTTPPSEPIDVAWWPVDSPRAPSSSRKAPAPPPTRSAGDDGRGLLGEVLADVAVRGELSRRTTVKLAQATANAFADTPLGRRLLGR